MTPHIEPDSARLLGGRYLLGEEFASGGMGTVHLGRVLGAGGFSRVVAIKRLFPGFAGDASFREMLLDEARFASRIRHPNVVPMLDVVEEGRDLYVVMEYVHGLSLAQLFEAGGKARIPQPIVLAIGEAVLLGLHAVHEARSEDGTPLGIVHRDVSPQNVLVGADGVPRLIDFGIAKAATRLKVTDPGVLKGKVAYMAPEQIVQESVSRHADVFAAGAVLWEMLAGRQLFAQAGVGDRLKRLTEPIPSALAAAGEPGDMALEGVIARALERDPSRRYPTAEAMAAALRHDRRLASTGDIAKWVAGIAPDELEISEERVRLLEQSPASVVAERPAPSAMLPTPSTVQAATAYTTVRPPAASRRRSRVGLAAITLVVLLVAVVGGRAALRGPAASLPVAVPASPAPIERESTPDPVRPAPSATVALTPAVPSDAPLTSPAPPSSAPLPARPPASHSRHSSKGKCDPPYTVDTNGIKHYDRSCF